MADLSAPRQVYLDVAPMFEEEWTGIPVVTAALARFGRGDASRTWRFLYNNQLLATPIVDELLFACSGRYLVSSLLDKMRMAPLPSLDEAKNGVGIFPNVKPVRAIFWKEAMVIHDLSTLLTPQYHNADTIAHHANRLRKDVETTDTFFCVSQATADDVQAYFRVTPARTLITPLGVEWPLRTRLQAARHLDRAKLPPFVLVLGTVEPRKNIALVLEFILADPSVLERYSFVFVGRPGWLDEHEKLQSAMANAGIPANRLLFTGYVSDAVKLGLLCTAQFLIFPSMFEGFGLPVLEARSVGCPVLCSNSSSLVEAAGADCVFFDPTDLTSFTSAFARIEVRLSASLKHRAVNPIDIVLDERLSWRRFVTPITAWLRSLD